MKKIFTLAVKRIIPLLFFTGVQFKAWAAEVTASTCTDEHTSIFTQPWIWIGAIVITILVLIGPLNYNREFPVIMKKRMGKKQRMEQYIK